MIDYLLRFDDEAAAIAALPGLHIAVPLQYERWTGSVLPVALVTADAVLGESGEDGIPPIIAERQVLPGFWLLASEASLAGEVASIDRATGALVAGDSALLGTRLDPVWAGGAAVIAAPVVEPEPEEPVPSSISDRQFAQQLAVLGVISEAEALAWAARGELPDAIEAAIAALPEAQRFSARMLLASATTYERSHPLVGALADLLGYDSGEIDDLWRAAALL